MCIQTSIYNMRRTAFRFYYDFNPFYTLIKWANTVNENDWWYQSNFDWWYENFVRFSFNSYLIVDETETTMTTTKKFWCGIYDGRWVLCSCAVCEWVHCQCKWDIDSEWATMIAYSFVRSLAHWIWKVFLRRFRYIWHYIETINLKSIAKNKNGDNSLTLDIGRHV